MTSLAIELDITPQDMTSRIYLRDLPTSLYRDNQRPDHLAFSVPPSQYKEVQEYKPVFHRLRLSASP